ncbi:BamA/TamA family outer membrane protein [Fulvivirga sp. 29W222]|uniref:BamA/TamA family outer membrane protein n=1 Tax=Fulvivirga marina TaxID=2494733 RepID=A0A937FWI2_9BACT|nr:BamA/TamA family outer membrane protein [Fulvivirga marina]MBL6445947.1 BamA/TamA family outer membrane protein [Fulvivirga marina]
MKTLKQYHISSLFFIMLLCFFQLTLAQETDSISYKKKVKLTPLPALFYTPETRLGFGGLISGVFNLGDREATRNSNAEVLAAYTLNNQIILRTKNNLFTRDEKYALSGEVSFYDFPILYYGVGNETEKDFEEELGYKVFIFEERVLKQVRKSLFIGPQYRFNHLYDIEYDPDHLIGDIPFVDNGAGTNSGLGFSAIYDTRNNVLNASKGVFLQFSTFFHGEALGGDFNFNRYTLDLRRYWMFKNGDVIAAQYFGEFNTGDIPFREMAQLGGENIMRGYYNGRFRDNQQMALQLEYRKQIIPWLGFTAFGAYGDVSKEVRNFDVGGFKYAVGAGLRIMVNKADRLNIRIDYGLGEDTSGFYFAIAEAF